MVQLNENFIYGRRVLEEFLRAKRRKLNLVYLTEESAKIFKNKLTRENIPFKITTKKEMFELSRRKDHQGVIGIVEPFQYYELSYLFDISPALVVALDNIQDVRNFGSIIRTSYLTGASGIIIPERESAKVSPVVVHTSAGASEYIPIIMVNSVPHTLNILKQRGFKIYGATSSASSLPFDALEYPSRVVTVFGNEGVGLSNKVKRICDAFIHIPQKGLLDSFNVSVACGIIIYFISKKIFQKN